jgi:Undecaprenyl-phosphate galactose phosphotransferase WbaP
MTTVSAIQKLNLVESAPGRPINMVISLVVTDLLTLLISVAISLACKLAANGHLNFSGYVGLWPFLFVFITVYAVAGLYSGVSLSPPEELRRATLSSTLVFILLAATTVSLRGASNYFTWTLFLAIGLSVALLPLSRAVVRQLCANESWWGSPAVIFGAGPESQSIVSALLADPGLGLKPVAVVDDEVEDLPAVHGVPVMSGYELAAALAGPKRFAYAVVTTPGVPNSHFLAAVERYGLTFSHILVIPDLRELSSLWVSTRSVGGMLGLEVCQQAFVPEGQWPKRLLDLFLTIFGALFVLPLIGLIALWIKRDSPGPIFYSQRRIGQGGKEFRAWKFRSMVQNADEVLHRYLESNPDLREEWEQNHKLRNDPRITRVGRFLRGASLDELPQLWNVLKGDMSLVGPRPIVDAEIVRYGSNFDLYTKVKSGLTGLWQVSGRNDTSYEERVKLDTFYVRNWSVWLDLCILFKTIGTVLLRKGAY